MTTKTPLPSLERDAAAHGVQRSTAEAVNKASQRPLYEKRRKIHPKAAHGLFRRLKWAILVVTLAVYYLTPWIRWDRGLNAPDQAILIDIPGRRFYFFFIEIWPQEVYYLTGLLIIAALALFLATSLFGRVWCGYTCPQTVWTDLFIAVEYMLEGNRAARMRGDALPWTAAKLARKAVKHVLWIAIAVLTGGAWVFYFADAPSLLADLVSLQAAPIAYIAIAGLAFTTYMLGGHAREQVCTYMCPWPRIQAAMVDEDTLVVTYREYRGEPRGLHRKNDSWEGRGDCIDCNQCVAVCPMGIDIRDGQQLECITCALCIDACNGVVEKVDRPRGLIAYDTLANLDRRTAGQPPRLRLLRLRPAIYVALIAIVGVLMLVTLGTRANLELNVLRDRNPLYVTLSDGSVRNGYTLKIINKLHQARDLRLSVIGSLPVQMSMLGKTSAEDLAITIGSDRLASFRVFLTVPATALQSESAAVAFAISDPTTDIQVTYDSVFRGPAQ
ncbi:MAG: cytochrome c oxidase accessory protein CcoG [Alphaproteobacteria bacterium]